MNYLKLFCSFSLELIMYFATGLVPAGAICFQSAHCDTLPPHFSATSLGFNKIIFAASKYDNSPQGAIVGFTRFNGKPLTFSSSTTTDDMAS
jgi:hypothetical protein